eukprot:CAMPEP_0181192750 /NCGR_PEP_ID=MMETSP1096-20121128/13450_1 /TAXON_ID=156174 ORGANISM="Chrysochromulina ericina, Strain CCMP281" /NCGR_SAMPLE_ID=MMETSP1096 /ASSEMBLY_ACC=CAM_ASM_000453 /LENGTH=40 /DNA_ID= /DNA_START= /DNA_END= /DNA_ORIENTATION=
MRRAAAGTGPVGLANDAAAWCSGGGGTRTGVGSIGVWAHA